MLRHLLYVFFLSLFLPLFAASGMQHLGGCTGVSGMRDVVMVLLRSYLAVYRDKLTGIVVFGILCGLLLTIKIKIGP